jgi:hypothetical protein
VSLSDLHLLRDALARLTPCGAHQANHPPQPEEIFAPLAHANALDPQRALVIGNRGVGKSFWSSVLTHDDTRVQVAASYPRLPLQRIRAKLGFHEAAGKDDGPAPSPGVLAGLQKQGHESETIGRAVLLGALRAEIGDEVPTSLKDIIDWMTSDIERSEAALRRADNSFLVKGQMFLLVFDALDRLGKSWDVITPLTEGILRLALDMRGFRAMKAKVFIRTDQSKDDSLFRFADASKIRADEVNLVWRRGELFGLLYNHLLKEDDVRAALFRLSGENQNDEIVNDLLRDEDLKKNCSIALQDHSWGPAQNAAALTLGYMITWLTRSVKLVRVVLSRQFNAPPISAPCQEVQ